MDFQIFTDIKDSLNDTVSLEDFKKNILPKFEEAQFLEVSEVELNAFNREIDLVKRKFRAFLLSFFEKALDGFVESMGEESREDLESWDIYAKPFIDEEVIKTMLNKKKQAEDFISLRGSIKELINDINEANEEVAKRELPSAKYSHISEVFPDIKNRFELIEKKYSGFSHFFQSRLEKHLNELRGIYNAFDEKHRGLDDAHRRLSTLVASNEFKQAIKVIDESNETSFTFKDRIYTSKKEALDDVRQQYRQYSEEKYEEYINTLMSELPEDPASGPIEINPSKPKLTWDDNLKRVMSLSEINSDDIVARVKNAQAALDKVITRFEKFERDLEEIRVETDHFERFNRCIQFPIDEVPALQEKWQDVRENTRKGLSNYLDQEIKTYQQMFKARPNDLQFDIQPLVKRIEDDAFADAFAEEKEILNNLIQHSQAYLEEVKAIKEMDNLEKIIDRIHELEKGYAVDGLPLPLELQEILNTCKAFKDLPNNIKALLEEAQPLIEHLDGVADFDFEEVSEIEERFQIFLDDQKRSDISVSVDLLETQFSTLDEAYDLIKQIKAVLEVRSLINNSIHDLSLIQAKMDKIKHSTLLEKIEPEEAALRQWQENDRKIEEEISRISKAIKDADIQGLVDAYDDIKRLRNLESTKVDQINALEDEIIDKINKRLGSYLEKITTVNYDHAFFERLLIIYQEKFEGKATYQEVQVKIFEKMAAIAENKGEWFDAFVLWQKLDEISSGGVYSANAQACLKIYIIKQFVKGREFQVDFNRFSCDRKADDDLDFLRLLIHSQLTSYEEILKDIDEVNEEALTNLRMFRRNFDNKFLLRNIASSEDDKKPGEDNLEMLPQKARYIHIVAGYENKPIAADVVQRFRKEIDPHELRQRVTDLEKVIEEMVEIKKGMRFQSSLTQFYYWRTHADDIRRYGYLPDRSKDRFEDLWNQYLNELKKQLPAGGH